MSYLLRELSDEETEVLELVVNGETNKAIALKLKHSDYWVKGRVSSIMDKLSAMNRVHAAAIAVHLRLATPVLKGEAVDLSGEAEPQESPPAKLTIARRPYWDVLTPREQEIFFLFGDASLSDKSNDAIAKHLAISKNTLRRHLRTIYDKLHLGSTQGSKRVFLAAQATQALAELRKQESEESTSYTGY